MKCNSVFFLRFIFKFSLAQFTLIECTERISAEWRSTWAQVSYGWIWSTQETQRYSRKTIKRRKEKHLLAILFGVFVFWIEPRGQDSVSPPPHRLIHSSIDVNAPEYYWKTPTSIPCYSVRYAQPMQFTICTYHSAVNGWSAND